MTRRASPATPDSRGTTRRAIGRSKNAGSTLTLRLAFGVNPQLWERESTQQRDERRFIAIGIVEGSTIAVVWTPRGTDRRIISPDRLPERNASNMARRSNAQIEHGKGRVNWEKVRATSDEEIERQRQADGEDVADDDDGLIIVTAAYVRRIREKLGLTQSQFADQFGLNQRTVQEWEADRSRVGTGQGGAGRSGTYPAARY